MKQLFFIFFCVLLAHCAKEAPAPANTTSSTADSLQGRWKYMYDYRLVATVANPTVIIDSVFSGHYTPYSYFEIKADSTYKWYRTTSLGLPTTGYGQSGKWWVDAARNVWLRMQYTTIDDFLHNTAVTPTASPYKIKYLGADSMVLYFRVNGADPSQYWYWHDVYKK